MKRESARRVPAEKAATAAEVSAAIEALTTPDLVRLKRFADRRVRRLGRKAAERTGDDLLQTAVSDLLQDRRRWDKTKVGFIGLLFGAMKSISSNWAKSSDPAEASILETDLLRKNEKGEAVSPFDSLQAPSHDAEQSLLDQETLREIDELFKDDDGAQMLLMSWQEGYDPAGVRELWGLSQNEYNTIVRRIRRTVDRAGAKYVR